MKKIFLILIGLILLWVTIQVMLDMGGGAAMIYRKVEYSWWSFESRRKHDPGQCAYIQDDTSQGNPTYLKENCFYTYMTARDFSKNECFSDRLIVDAIHLSSMNASDRFRQGCLLNYYKHIFSSPEAKSLKACTGLSDRLIEFSYHRQNIWSHTYNALDTPTKNPFITDLDLFENCEEKIKDQPRESDTSLTDSR